MLTYRIPLNSRVRLRDGIDPALYKGFSCTGNEGWIREHRKDDHGYTQVLIEWDHDHWSYNGAPNCWTWEEHFDLVEEDMSDTQEPDRKQKLQNLTEQFVQGIMDSVEESAKSAPTGQVADETSSDLDEKNIPIEAKQAIDTSKAFILVSVQEDEKGGQKIIYPAIYTHAEDERWALVCQGHVGHLMTLLYDSLLQEKLSDKFAKDPNVE